MGGKEVLHGKQNMEKKTQRAVETKRKIKYDTIKDRMQQNIIS